MSDASAWLPGVHAAPNIQGRPDLYEIENRAADPDQHIEAHMRTIAPIEGAVVVDLGGGAGFHAARFAELGAQHVFMVEPHGPSRLLAMRRAAEAGLSQVSVVAGSAERIFLPDGCADWVHARFAYFWGPGCEAGLAEVMRVLKPGGAVVIVDNDLRHGTFAQWLARSPYISLKRADARDAFWRAQGFSCHEVMSAWRFDTRAELEAVVRNEFPAELAEAIVAEHDGLEISYGYALMSRLR